MPKKDTPAKPEAEPTGIVPSNSVNLTPEEEAREEAEKPLILAKIAARGAQSTPAAPEPHAVIPGADRFDATTLASEAPGDDVAPRSSDEIMAEFRALAEADHAAEQAKTEREVRRTELNRELGKAQAVEARKVEPAVTAALRDGISALTAPAAPDPNEGATKAAFLVSQRARFAGPMAKAKAAVDDVSKLNTEHRLNLNVLAATDSDVLLAGLPKTGIPAIQGRAYVSTIKTAVVHVCSALDAVPSNFEKETAAVQRLLASIEKRGPYPIPSTTRDARYAEAVEIITRLGYLVEHPSDIAGRIRRIAQLVGDLKALRESCAGLPERNDDDDGEEAPVVVSRLRPLPRR